jgi:hypothetical protein
MDLELELQFPERSCGPILDCALQASQRLFETFDDGIVTLGVTSLLVVSDFTTDSTRQSERVW